MALKLQHSNPAIPWFYVPPEDQRATTSSPEVVSMADRMAKLEERVAAIGAVLQTRRDNEPHVWR